MTIDLDGHGPVQIAAAIAQTPAALTALADLILAHDLRGASHIALPNLTRHPWLEVRIDTWHFDTWLAHVDVIAEHAVPYDTVPDRERVTADVRLPSGMRVQLVTSRKRTAPVLAAVPQ